jgi:hypothetical protein
MQKYIVHVYKKPLSAYPVETKEMCFSSHPQKGETIVSEDQKDRFTVIRAMLTENDALPPTICVVQGFLPEPSLKWKRSRLRVRHG